MAGNRGSTVKEPAKEEEEEESLRSGRVLRSIFSCRGHNEVVLEERRKKKKSKKDQIWCSGSLCSLTGDDSKNVMMQRRDLAKGTVSASAGKAAPRRETNRVLTVSTSSSSSSSSSVRGMYMSRLTGCYECSIAVGSVNGFSRASVCPDCGEMFAMAESLELHQALRHAVSELGHDDTSRSIVEIIFQSSWLKKETPVCKIERILKVHNTEKTASAFEDYRGSVKTRASKLPKKHPRCIADGNELLRFYCTSSKCSLGLDGSTGLCDSIPRCEACSIIRDGMKADAHGRIRMMSTSGRAHDAVRMIESESCEKRAMLVCRVIAGRVKKSPDGRPDDEEFDSVAGTTGVYSDLDELYVFNPKSILPCFVVIYRDA